MVKYRRGNSISSTSSEEDDILRARAEKPNRKAQKPKRMGISDWKNEAGAFSDNESEQFEDSFDEYQPSPKKQKRTHAKGNSSSFNRKNELVSIDFNSQFDTLNRSNRENLPVADNIHRTKSLELNTIDVEKLPSNKNPKPYDMSYNEMHLKWYKKIYGKLN